MQHRITDRVLFRSVRISWQVTKRPYDGLAHLVIPQHHLAFQAIVEVNVRSWRMTAFSTLPLKPALLASIETLGYTTMTPVQAQSLPPMLEGRDVIAQAQTGSGKTAAFGLSLLQSLGCGHDPAAGAGAVPDARAGRSGEQGHPQAGGEHPQREAADLCGGMPLGPQLASLTHDPHIVVGTPGRVQEHLKREACTAAASRCWCWTRLIACSTWVSAKPSTTSSGASPSITRRCCSRRLIRTRSAP
jgi:hypothetical protein